MWRKIPVRYRLACILIVFALAAGARLCSSHNARVDSGQIGEPTAGQSAAAELYGKGSAELLKVRPAQGSSPLDEEMLYYAAMDVSFNPSLHIPNWVAWELTADETAGEVKRSNKFFADPGVVSCATTDDYRNSGYDRGHMAPAGDMKWSREAMDETFYLTNICPQNKSLNSGAWKKLEEKCRVWAKRDSAIVIVCGPVTTDPVEEYIGTTKVAVPKRFFKVVLAPYACPPRAIGFIMENSAGNSGMQNTATSVREIEKITGLDFFSALPDDIEQAVETNFNFHTWEK